MIIEYEFNGDYFEYEITQEELMEYLRTIPKNELLNMIFDLIEEIDLFDYLKDYLTDYFESDARRQYYENKDPLGSIGMSQSDFI